MSRPLKLSLSAFAGVILDILIAYALASAWYYDDGCNTDQWKCDVGGFGLGLFFVCIVAAAAIGIWVLIELATHEPADGVSERRLPKSHAAAAMLGTSVTILLLVGALALL